MLLTAQALLERNPAPDPARSARPSAATTAAAPAITRSCRPRSARRTGAARTAPGRFRRWRLRWPLGRPAPDRAARRRARAPTTDDVAVSRLLHAAFVRSPHAHARIAAIDTAEAAALPGVMAVVTGRELAAHCEPWVGVLKNYAGMKSAPQYPLALDKAVLAGRAGGGGGGGVPRPRGGRLRARARDVGAAAAGGRRGGRARPRLAGHPSGAGRQPGATRRGSRPGDVAAAFATADAVYRETFDTGRHTVRQPGAAGACSPTTTPPTRR